MEGEVEAKLSVQSAKKQQIAKLHLNEKTFRWMLNEDAMATEKLAEGIRNFAADMNKLKDLIRQQLQ
ncbi:Transaldolase, related [Eimeria necatrix]|uniref:Transaldolase, related n=1 Tax=Eimeria necatrix TaxID=51315 RepID=U6MQJ8_9EIME|nr:Transaldolase, related [Eimeria necatrix]CDJ66286.1 Transaldolase, related [Eimeria necatrix]